MANRQARKGVWFAARPHPRVKRGYLRCVPAGFPDFLGDCGVFDIPMQGTGFWAPTGMQGSGSREAQHGRYRLEL